MRFSVILLTVRQTDRETNEHGQKHLPRPLSEVISLYASLIKHYFLAGISHGVEFKKLTRETGVSENFSV